MRGEIKKNEPIGAELIVRMFVQKKSTDTCTLFNCH